MCAEQRSVATICWTKSIARPQRRGLVSLSIKIYPSFAARRAHSVRVAFASDDAGQLPGEDAIGIGLVGAAADSALGDHQPGQLQVGAVGRDPWGTSRS